LKAVLEALKQASVDRTPCLGDIAGCGPQPLKSLASVRSVCDGIMLGDQEAMAAPPHPHPKGQAIFPALPNCLSPLPWGQAMTTASR